MATSMDSGYTYCYPTNTSSMTYHYQAAPPINETKNSQKSSKSEHPQVASRSKTITPTALSKFDSKAKELNTISSTLKETTKLESNVQRSDEIGKILRQWLSEDRSGSSGVRLETCQKVLETIVEPECDVELMTFKAISTNEYDLIRDILDEESSLASNARLTYFFNSGDLIIKWPSTIHEAPMVELHDAVTKAMLVLDYPPDLVRAKVHNNTQLSGEDSETYPDLQLILSFPIRRNFPPAVLLVAECGFSQSKEEVITKMQSQLAGNPDICLAVMVLIDEDNPYHKPDNGSPVFDTFRKENDVRTFDAFIPEERQGSQGLVVVEGHTWCHVTTIKYQVWIKGEDGHIDLLSDNPVHTAQGTLFPDNQMDAVSRMLNRGMALVHAHIVTVLNKADPTVDHASTLRAPSNYIQIDWQEALDYMFTAIDMTAYSRYKAWYRKSFRGKKRRNVDSHVDDRVRTMAVGSASRSTVLPVVGEGPITRSRSLAAQAQAS